MTACRKLTVAFGIQHGETTPEVVSAYDDVIEDAWRGVPDYFLNRVRWYTGEIRKMVVVVPNEIVTSSFLADQVELYETFDRAARTLTVAFGIQDGDPSAGPEYVEMYDDVMLDAHCGVPGWYTDALDQLNGNTREVRLTIPEATIVALFAVPTVVADHPEDLQLDQDGQWRYSTIDRAEA